ncbi:hypothetical protein U0070_025887 [Myodes glareolus]|uniref:Uncharacterized protein n=1 Tax=Myodes glareolus TaxID=447135 RepID=A0AAW0HU15_MYOGA
MGFSSNYSEARKGPPYPVPVIEDISHDTETAGESACCRRQEAIGLQRLPSDVRLNIFFSSEEVILDPKEG